MENAINSFIPIELMYIRSVKKSQKIERLFNPLLINWTHLGCMCIRLECMYLLLTNKFANSTSFQFISPLDCVNSDTKEPIKVEKRGTNMRVNYDIFSEYVHEGGHYGGN